MKKLGRPNGGIHPFWATQYPFVYV